MREILTALRTTRPLSIALAGCHLLAATSLRATDTPQELLEFYCFECHDDSTQKGNLDLTKPLTNATLIFENLATGKMPPAKKDQPTPEEKQHLLSWLAQQDNPTPPDTFRRLTRHEFVTSINDLLRSSLDLTHHIPEDRGTSDFSTDRRIKLSREILSSYFSVADKTLDFALPLDGFTPAQTWVTNQIKESHETYRIYHSPYQEGTLFSWTRANNGNSYSFFYDNFDPPVAGWYNLTFDAAKVGDFPEDISVQIHAGKYYIADDRPQPQRLLGIISLGNRELKSHNLRVFLNPGENISVHCHSKHNFRKQNTTQGAYLKQLTVHGPLHDQWPPLALQPAFPKFPPTAPIKGIPLPNPTPKHLNQIITRFAERAFSTQLTDEELSPYLQVSLDEFSSHQNFLRATKAGLKAIISSPRFLIVPGEHSSPSHTTAAHLARTLWLSVPDDELLTLAHQNKLSGDTLRSQIQRMLDHPKSERLTRSFANQWLNLRSLDKVSPSLKLYPKYDDLLNHYLPRETHAFLHHLIQENQPVTHLIHSPYAFLNQRLAQHYELPNITGQHLRKVKLPPKTTRGGILTQGSILKVTTDGHQTSPILRGAWISKNLIGTPLSPPPESIEAIEPEHGEHALSLREQIEEHKSNKTCYACHKSIDPYGFALESFDATGQWRDRYRIKLPHQNTFTYRISGYFELGSPVDASGEINNQVFTNISDLKTILISHPRKIAYNLSKKFFQYATGTAPNLPQRLHLLELIAQQNQPIRTRDLLTETLLYSLTQQTP